jgi:hypothetical protein
MARETAVTQSIDRSLRYNHAMLDELLDVTEEWDEIPDGELAGWTMDWHQFAFDKIKRITEAYVNGAMTPEQEREYRRLIQRIEHHRDLIERFGLTMPRIPVET